MLYLITDFSIICITKPPNGHDMVEVMMIVEQSLTTIGTLVQQLVWRSFLKNIIKTFGKFYFFALCRRRLCPQCLIFCSNNRLKAKKGLIIKEDSFLTTTTTIRSTRFGSEDSRRTQKLLILVKGRTKIDVSQFQLLEP